jgi:fumarylacetoacetase
MTPITNETHDPALKSWVESANSPGGDFPVQNLPFGICRPKGSNVSPRVGIAIGDFVLDVAGANRAGLLGPLPEPVSQACEASSLNKLMALGREHWSALRRRAQNFLGADAASVAANQEAGRKFLLPLAGAELFLPANVGDYTDFYASIHHATNVGRLLRPDNPLLPNYKWMPIAYHGRASSIVVSGTPVRRPCGQCRSKTMERVEYGPTARLDYELEVGFYMGPGNVLGTAIPMSEADSHIFGACLVNDWSARDIQAWEYQPLGPFLGKNFCTTVSPWVVTLEALAPFRAPASRRTPGDPGLLLYLSDEQDKERGGLDMTVEAWIRTPRMREQKATPVRLSSGNFKEMYWTMAQMLVHHASNGCNLRPGDLLASGTVSSATSHGCLLELTDGGGKAVDLPDGEKRRFLADGDEIIFRASCQAEGFVRIGFGECRGVVLPAAHSPQE